MRVMCVQRTAEAVIYVRVGEESRFLHRSALLAVVGADGLLVRNVMILCES